MPILLHVNILHIALNVFFQLSMGVSSERDYGSRQFALIFLLTGVGVFSKMSVGIVMLMGGQLVDCRGEQPSRQLWDMTLRANCVFTTSAIYLSLQQFAG